MKRAKMKCVAEAKKPKNPFGQLPDVNGLQATGGLV